MEPIKIASLRLENVKRVRAVQMQPTENGLTIIGGRNGQGKTSVLDAIAWALGGDKYKPSSAQRDGSYLPPDLEVKLSNGIIVQRKGKSSTLTVTDQTGKRGGQTLLNEFVSQFAIDLPKFLESSDKDKAETLLQIIGVGPQLEQLERQENTAYTQRRYVGQEADKKRKHAEDMPYYEGVPDAPVSAGELIQRQQAILMRNAENRKARDNMDQLEQMVQRQQGIVMDLRERLKTCTDYLEQLSGQLDEARVMVEGLTDEPTEELENDIQQVDEINRKVRANLDRQKADDDAKVLADRYGELSTLIEEIRQKKNDLLNGADLPLPGLDVKDGILLYNGKAWDCMSGSEQLIVGASIAAAIKPQCGFILLDKMEQLDRETLDTFGEWLKARNLQAIATRVSTGEECTIIIEDGSVQQEEAEIKPVWTPGQF